MSNLNSIGIKSVYRTGEDDLLKDFYLPVLEHAYSYDRAVGFFSTSLLEYAMKGISAIIKNDGQMRLIVGYPLDADEFASLQQGVELKNLSIDLCKDLDELVASANSGILNYRLNLFMLLIATNKLTMKFAYRPKGMYHEKIGIIKDTSGNKILFQGSANETTNAIHVDLNFESITVYRSWIPDVYNEYAQPFERGFEKLWNAKDKNVITLDMPSELYSKISEYCRDSIDLDSLPEMSELDLVNNYSAECSNNYPLVPSKINNKIFKPFPHQELALRDWFAAGGNGLFRLATGAGKTITAMYGVSKIFETVNRPTKILLIVAVPYQALAEQWGKELAMFNMKPIRCYNSINQWEIPLNDSINLLQAGTLEFVSVVVVNKTLCSDKFQSSISRISPDNRFFIGDECHRHATNLIIKKLPKARFKMGLSATPYIETDEFNITDTNEKDLLTSYYGDVVAEYSLANALADGVLTPYNYYMHIVPLSEFETEEYGRLSKQIGRLMSIDSSKDNKALSNAIRKRNKIISNAENKTMVLDKLLRTGDFEDKAHSLFYVGEGSSTENSDNIESALQEDISQLEVLSSMIARHNWKLSKFTSLESSKSRKSIMNNFVSKRIDGLVSMRVLDEGIDLPMCKRAFILASSRNSRQFIQRRGRILRKAPGKQYADIYDFIVVPNTNRNDSVYFETLVRRELTRSMEFIRLSLNRSESEQIAIDIADEYLIQLEEL